MKCRFYDCIRKTECRLTMSKHTKSRKYSLEEHWKKLKGVIEWKKNKKKKKKRKGKRAFRMFWLGWDSKFLIKNFDERKEEKICSGKSEIKKK